MGGAHMPSFFIYVEQMISLVHDTQNFIQILEMSNKTTISQLHCFH